MMWLVEVGHWGVFDGMWSVKGGLWKVVEAVVGGGLSVGRGQSLLGWACSLKCGVPLVMMSDG